MRLYKKIWLALFVLMVAMTACAMLTPQSTTAPQTLKQQIAYAYATVGGLEQAAGDGLSRGSLQLTEAKYVHDQASQIYQLLDAARDASGVGANSQAQSKLDQANGVLNALSLYLHQRSVGVPAQGATQ